MKTKFLYIAALALLVGFTACKNEDPFDTQSPDDAPLILKPYNESGTGSFTYVCDSPDTPLFDSVTVTPSKHTTVNWYLDGELVFTGTKINMCFPVGKYALTIEAVTQAGKSTKRTGSLTVKPFESDPYSAAPAIGRHVPAGKDIVLDGKNLDKVAKVMVSKDIDAKDALCSVAPSAKTTTQLTFALSDIADGKYYLRFQDEAGKVYGSDALEVHHGPVVTSGYDSFFPKDANWVIEGINLQSVAKVKIDGSEIVPTSATETTLSLVAPDMPKNSTHRMSMQDSNGKEVLFATGKGTEMEVEVLCTDQTPLWAGPVALDWNADLVKVTKEQMVSVAAGDSIFVYFETPAAEYHAFRITTPWWGDPPSLQTDLVMQINGFDQYWSPFSFVYDQRCKGLVDERGAMSIVGFGVTINKITYKPAE